MPSFRALLVIGSLMCLVVLLAPLGQGVAADDEQWIIGTWRSTGMTITFKKDGSLAVVHDNGMKGTGDYLYDARKRTLRTTDNKGVKKQGEVAWFNKDSFVWAEQNTNKEYRFDRKKD